MAPKWFCFLVLFLFATFVNVCAKECTNTPTQLSSHSVRYQLTTTTDEHWKSEMLSHYHLTPTDESTWMDLMPRKLLNKEAPVGELDWLMLYRSIKSSGAIDSWQGGNFLSEVSLNDVRIDPDSIYGRAQQTNLEYLLSLDVDRLVHNFRNQSGLPAPGKPYGGWEAADVELRGHFVGHYMSASALMWASTHNDTLYGKMTSVVDALYDCQKQMGTGYLSAFPTELFDRFEAVKYVWAPYYTIHKIMAGLLDQYTFAGNSKGLEMVVWMAEYFGNRVKNVLQKYTIERHWTSLNEETGGMNDVLYRLYTLTKDEKHLILAHLFDKPCFLGLLAVQADSLSGFHTNTHIPVVVGAQMRYEITGDPLYKEIGTFFMDIVNSSHAYATGGTSISEFWSDPKRLADTLHTENEESCTTYNMLKVSRHLFRWTKEIAYADYYERALINGVLSIQRGREPGIMIYMLPLGSGQSKARSYHGWGTTNESFWCCYGTGIESFSKLGDSIYFEEKGSTPGLYIIQFIPSTFNWKARGISLTQEVKPVSSSEPFLQVTLTVSANEGNNPSSTLNVRIPSWTSRSGAKAALNAQSLDLTNPGDFLSVTKNWASGDTLDLQFPLSLRTEAIKDDRPEYALIQAILYGPYLLAGLSTGDWDVNAGNYSGISDWITPVPSSYNSQLSTLTQPSDNSNTLFVTYSNTSLTLERQPEPGTDSEVHATFRIYTLDSKGRRSIVNSPKLGSYVMIEPFDLPGMVVTNSLAISRTKGPDTVFHLVQGLDGNPNSVSLELGSKPGCFVHGGAGSSNGTKVQVQCRGSLKDGAEFSRAASFVIVDGLRSYHPISFAAKGAKRNFLLQPLMSLRDESYTVYFNLGA
ncbi:uncharacterized protein LOC109724716 [Ananas comosus]|uniref:Uncharacterized protein LOC109724716 n=1 Tax=Ananas comosus TaxID=4615 RepID=A0A6P5GTL6_ANACO|nr:uncharacterized protein LOC109724716 [Ananas comosus]